MTTAAPAASFSLSTVLRQPVTDSDGRGIGVLADIVVRLRGGSYPLVTGLVVDAGDTSYYATAGDLVALGPRRIRLAAGAGELVEYRPQEGEVLLSEDVLGHRLIDVTRAALGKAYDIRLSPAPEGWAATGLDVHRLRWLSPGPHHAAHAPRDWNDFDPLIGHAGSAQIRAATGRILHLKPAQIADIIEESVRLEQAELLARLHQHPELEADVFEEFDRPV